METPGLSPNFPWSDRSCKRAQISRGTREFDMSFSEDKALTIVQDVAKNEHHGPPIGVQGSVVLRQAYPDSPGPSVVIETVVNHEDLDVSVHWDATEQFLTVKVPHDTPWDDTSSRPCLSVSITVYVPESATLQTLTVSAIHLDISLLDNLSLSVLSATALSSTVGTIVSASTGSPAHDPSLLDTNHAPSSFRFHCPSIHAHTVSAPIYVSFTPPPPPPPQKLTPPQGAWPLHTQLSLTSISGALRTLISPAPGSSFPATLTASTTSGPIDLRSPIHAAQKAIALSRYLGSPGLISAEHHLPPRDYRVTVQSQSGAVRAALPFSSGAAFRSTSGTLDVQLLPVLGEDHRGVVSTASVSGRTKVEVFEPLWIDRADSGTYATTTGRPLRGLVGEHSATSGKVVLAYPGSWEGGIELKAVGSGKLSVKGRGVEVVRSGRGQLVARKGEEGKGAGRIRGEVVSGGVDVLVGEEVEA